MDTKLQKLKWELYLRKKYLLFKYGCKKGFIRYYDDELINKLRNVYYGGIPASIILLCKKMCVGHCYDRALLMTLGIDDDFKLVDADISSLSLNPKNIDIHGKTPHYGNHCFVEVTKSDGIVWVYDTTEGLVFEKNLYYKMEHPKITKINDKQATTRYIEYLDIKNANIEKDKYMALSILPKIESTLGKPNEMYSECLKQEIELFKKLIDYDKLYEERQLQIDKTKNLSKKLIQIFTNK